MNDDIQLTLPEAEVTVTLSYRKPITFDGKYFMKKFGKKFNKEQAATTLSFVRVLPERGRWSGAEIILNDYVSQKGSPKYYDVREFVTWCFAATRLPKDYDAFHDDSTKAIDDMTELLTEASPKIEEKEAVYHIVYGDINIIITVRICE